ncbi:hypothetical protein B0T16DRAFT_451783 [Cercophora newfieldiana]|uniref:DUF7905 domain-containing protein n=1 Tax=Cercophora newfieldiana TaxID=92897 RepID=A0AA40CYD9_9PEZI|nr:hypothetical protein B0T16DRAFT_451783 [Cercophora newfieldiana]
MDRRALQDYSVYKVKLHVVLPLPNHGYDSIDADDDRIGKTLQQLERELLVKIEADEDGKTLTIYAFTRPKARDALLAVQRLLMKKEDTDPGAWHPRVVLCASDVLPESHRILSLQAHDSHPGRRAIFCNLPTIGGSVDLTTGHSNHRYQLKTALDLVTKVVRHLPNKMRMRVNFGQVLLQEWKKDKERYSKAELEVLLHRAGTRGTAQMLSQIATDAMISISSLTGTESMIGDVHRRLSGSGNQLLPLGARPSAGTLVPTYSVILVTKNLTVESKIEMSSTGGQPQANSSTQREYCFSPVQVFELETSERALEVMVACPHMLHDWSLVVKTEVESTKAAKLVPFTAETLQRSAVFTDRRLAGNFPCFRFKDQFTAKHRIHNIVGKVTWTYLLDKMFVAELNVFYKWGTDLNQKPVSAFNMTLYSSDWDYLLEEANLAAGYRDWASFADTFLQDRDVADKSPRDDAQMYHDFLTKVEGVQNILDGAKTAWLERQKTRNK